jgi:Rrf2 family protein
MMVDLAIHYGDGHIFLKDIAERQDISEKYLWQLTGPLKTAGLIKSTRGPQGGFGLAKKPSEITLKDIVSILEGSLCIVDCIEDPSVCSRSGNCLTRDVWSEASEKIVQTLSSISLQDMVDKEKGVLKK